MNGNNFKFINITQYAPEEYNILDENDKLIAYVYTRWGQTDVYLYKNNDIDLKNSIFSINYDDQHLGAIPTNMINNVFDSIKHKLNQYLNDIQ